MPGDLSAHFSRSEFACKGKNCCGGSSPMSEALISRLEGFRAILKAHLGKDTPLYINSGFRCLVHNREIGSNDSSQHPLGLAVDIDHPKDVEEEAFYRMIKPYFKGIGRYSSFTHVDIRNSHLAYWDNRTKTESLHAS